MGNRLHKHGDHYKGFEALILLKGNPYCLLKVRFYKSITQSIDLKNRVLRITPQLIVYLYNKLINNVMCYFFSCSVDYYSMKKILFTFLLISLYSCQENKEENLPEISVVKEEHQKRNEVFISLNDTINSFFTNLQRDEMQGKPEMLFLGKKESNISVIIPTDKSIKILGGDPSSSLFYELKVERGDSILINLEKININKSKQLQYPTFEVLNSNKNWSENNFDYLLYRYNINNQAIVIDENFRKNIYDAEKVYENSIILLDSLKENNSISSNFYSTTRINQKLKIASFRIKKSENLKIELIIKDLGLKLNDDALLTNKEYISFLKTLILCKYFSKNKRVLNSAQFDYINDNETFLDKKQQQALLDSYLKSIFFVEKSKFKEYLSKFNNITTDEKYKDKWLLIVENQRIKTERQNKRNRNIGILTNLVNDNEFTFEQILSNHEGKVVLVDFWASWCSPCRKEMPFIKGLKSKFNENDFEVIEISIDEDYSAWAKASNMEHIAKEEGNYIISNWKKSNLYQNYKINTIPRYLLFDNKGKIIDNDAPRPSDIKLVELIKANL